MSHPVPQIRQHTVLPKREHAHNIKPVFNFYRLRVKPIYEVIIIIIIFNYALQPSRLIVRSALDVPTLATKRLHACHHARAPSGGRWNCGREMTCNFA
jgi:hypothetical protein